MKTTKSILASFALILLVSVTTMAQSKAKVIAVINKAEWCPVCKANGQRAMAAFMADNKDGSIQFVANNLTNEATTKKSAEELKKLGLEKAMAPYRSTGVVYFFNSKSKTLISQLSIAKSDQQIADALLAAKNDLK